MRQRSISIAGFAALALGLAGCASGTSDGSTGNGGVTVVATTTIWGSIADQIVSCAGTGQTVTLMPVGADPHDYAPSSTDVATMVNADLVVSNGLGLEGGLASALKSAAADGANIFEVAPQLDPIPLAAATGDDHDGSDPHVWQDMGRVATAATLIGDEMAAVTGDDAFASCGQQVSAEILATEQQVIATLSVVPADRRILVTDHDALAYFAQAYGFTIAGVAVPGGSTLAEPSSAELAALTQTIESTGVPAIFSNTAASAAVVDAVAAEVGNIEVVALYVDSVGEPGSGAETYQGMMMDNAKSIGDALA